MSGNVIGLTNKASVDTYRVIWSDGTTFDLPTPQIELKYTEEDLQLEAWRDEAGYLHKIEARKMLHKVELTWPYLSDAELALIRRACKTQEYFRFQFYCDAVGTQGYLDEAYSGDLTMTLYSLRYGEGEWIDVHLSIIER
jgi:hypothetical protein